MEPSSQIHSLAKPGYSSSNHTCKFGLSADNCYDPTIIKEPKSSHIHIISTISRTPPISLDSGKLYTGLSWAGNRERRLVWILKGPRGTLPTWLCA